jgi:hypothetical protein
VAALAQTAIVSEETNQKAGEILMIVPLFD